MEAQSDDKLGEYGYFADDLKALKDATKVNGLWSQGLTPIYPVYVSRGENDWYKTKPEKDTMSNVINWILGGKDKKIIDRELIGIFFSEKDAMKVYDAIPVREES